MKILLTGSLLLLIEACLLAGCGHPKEGTQSAELRNAAQTANPDARDIAWFKGSVEQATAAAAKDNKLLLVYWGAKWCPYCQALKKTVFTRPDFIEKTALFVPVYLDGDLPGAQAWGETFKISGYPTLLILKPDRTELARMSGGMDLSLYAGLLDEALQDQRPILGVLATGTSQQDCHRLAYYGWDPAALADVDSQTPTGMDPGQLAARLSAAAERCRGAEQVRLQIAALNFALLGDAKHPQPEDHAQLVERVRALRALLAYPIDVRPAIDLIAALDDSIFKIVIQQGAGFTDQFRARWVARMQEAADDAQFGDADRLMVLASALDATKALTPDHTIPAAMQTAAHDRIRQALDADRDRFKRNDLVNAASIIYDELGDSAAAHDLYIKELPNTRTPYYYMSHLAALAERQGNSQEALDWMAKAYAASEGPATRLRWGSSYVRALIRLSPNDTAGIRSGALKVAADVAQSDAVHGRSRTAVLQINKALGQWANTPERRAVAAEIAAHFPQESAPSAG